MSRYRHWTTTEVRRLNELRAMPLRIKDIAVILGRTENAIHAFIHYVPCTPSQRATVCRLGTRRPSVQRDTSRRLRLEIQRGVVM